MCHCILHYFLDFHIRWDHNHWLHQVYIVHYPQLLQINLERSSSKFNFSLYFGYFHPRQFDSWYTIHIEKYCTQNHLFCDKQDYPVMLESYMMLFKILFTWCVCGERMYLQILKYLLTSSSNFKWFPFSPAISSKMGLRSSTYLTIGPVVRNFSKLPSSELGKCPWSDT